MTRTILVPIDGSPLSFKALRHALSAFPDASITVLHVADLFEPGYDVHGEFETAYEPLMGTAEWYERVDDVTNALFEEARQLAADYDREITTESEIGDPKRVVVDYVDEEAIDHVVIGAHGRTSDRPMYGSVAEVVVRRSAVPVTIVR
ncbi:MAG: universal stress protein [Halobacteriota archaeon]